MLHRSFNRGLQRLISKVKWPMYIVNVNRDFRCTCLDVRANEGNPSCPKCLGTGYKIKIRKIEAVKQPYTNSSRSSGASNNLQSVTSIYYISSDQGEIKLGDLMVHENEIEAIKFVRVFRSDSSNVQFYEAPAVLKKYNGDTFINNFNKLISQE